MIVVMSPMATREDVTAVRRHHLAGERQPRRRASILAAQVSSFFGMPQIAPTLNARSDGPAVRALVRASIVCGVPRGSDRCLD